MPDRPSHRNLRADAKRNIETLVRTARDIFATSGVETPMREIADRAGVGVGTIYRNFPQRSDLIAAVFRSEVDACAEAAADLARTYPPGEALDRWMQRYVDFIVAKRGLAAALHSGDPAFEALPAYFDSRFEPALRRLLDAAVAAEEIRPDANPYDLLRAVASLCMPSSDGDPAPARRLVALLVDGLRYRAVGPQATSASLGHKPD
ncbi:MAG: helix-turn-helix transcriptional regulator [Rhodobacteraceae bacterium]|nr:helix-turn-helix transcriptional regulator [Paracoccaceae bacterium]